MDVDDINIVMEHLFEHKLISETTYTFDFTLRDAKQNTRSILMDFIERKPDPTNCIRFLNALEAFVVNVTRNVLQHFKSSKKVFEGTSSSISWAFLEENKDRYIDDILRTVDHLYAHRELSAEDHKCILKKKNTLSRRNCLIKLISEKRCEDKFLRIFEVTCDKRHLEQLRRHYDNIQRDNTERTSIDETIVEDKRIRSVFPVDEIEYTIGTGSIVVSVTCLSSKAYEQIMEDLKEGEIQNFFHRLFDENELIRYSTLNTFQIKLRLSFKPTDIPLPENNDEQTQRQRIFRVGLPYALDRCSSSKILRELQSLNIARSTTNKIQNEIEKVSNETRTKRVYSVLNILYHSDDFTNENTKQLMEGLFGSEIINTELQRSAVSTGHFIRKHYGTIVNVLDEDMISSLERTAEFFGDKLYHRRDHLSVSGNLHVHLLLSEIMKSETLSLDVMNLLIKNDVTHIFESSMDTGDQQDHIQDMGNGKAMFTGEFEIYILLNKERNKKGIVSQYDDISWSLTLHGGSQRRHTELKQTVNTHEADVTQIHTEAMKTNDSIIPLELRAMGSQYLDLFTKSLKEGKYKSYVIRVMIVGHYGVGKTTLTKKLLRLEFDPSKDEGTEGLEIYVGHCYMDRYTGKWTHGVKRKDKSLAEDLRDHGVIDDMKEEFKKIAKGEDKEPDSEVETKAETMYNPVQESTDEEEHMEDDHESLGISQPPFYGDLMNKMKRIKAYTNVGNTEIQVPDHSNLVKAVFKKISHGDEKYTSIEIWDFGGQGGYGATHQSFLSHRAIYLLVFNISKKLDHYINDMDLDPSERRNSTVREFLSFWINSIKTYGGDGIGNCPKILVVGTHLDEVDTAERSQRVKEYMLSIQKAYENDIADGHLILDKNLMFGLHEDDNIEILQKAITKAAEDQPFWGEELPKAWIPFQHHISELRQSGAKIISMEQIINFNKSLPAPLDKENIDLCLHFLHSVGSIMFYSGSGLSNFVIIEPMLLVSTLRSLITSEIFCTEEARKEAYLDLKHNGMISQEHIDKIWKLQKFSYLEPFKEHLLTIMERLDLIAKPKTYQNGSIIDAKFYFIPSMGKEDPEDQKWLTKIMESNRVRTIEIDFSSSFLSPAVYYRVISSCISIWPVTRGKLYFGCCQLSLDAQHRMLIRKKGDKICLVFEHRRSAASLNISLIKAVVEVVVDMLQHIIEFYPWRRDGNVYEVKGNLEKDSYIPKESEDCPQSCSGKGNDVLQKTPTELELMRFVRNLVGAKDKYYMIGVCLIGTHETEQIEHDCMDSLNLKLFYILIAWLRKEGSACSFEKLIKTAECDQHDICKDKDVKVYQTIPKTRLEETCTDEMIDSVSVFIGKDFMHFGLELGLSLADIAEIQSSLENRGFYALSNRIMKVTRERKHGANLSMRTLCCALLRINRFDCFENFVNQFIHKLEGNVDDWQREGQHVEMV